MICILGHKYVEIDNKVMCEKCGLVWEERINKEKVNLAIILKKENSLETILEEAKNENTTLGS